LTAQEISEIDFRGLDLAVLSACQSGLGHISADGVQGLQRGFKKAGCNSIIMSLWNVDDEATQILMTTFYKEYLSGKTKLQAFENAKRELRNHQSFKDAKYWAAFILLDSNK
jgi:CHAT domain-containing protein